MKNQVAAMLAVAFGSLYTLSRKYQCVLSIDEEGKEFNQPILQTFIIFIGMASIILFRPIIPKEQQLPGKLSESKFIYIIPSLLDVLGTVSDTAGLYYTSVSVSQMLKGATLFFTYLITIIFFKKKLLVLQHLWMLSILISLGLIGYSNADNSNIIYESRPLLGNSLIFVSQLIFALMFITEQRIAKKYNIQVKNAVMWEGIWGVAISFLFIVVFTYMGSTADHLMEESAIQKIFRCDIMYSCSLIASNWKLLATVIATALCISPFNYFGLLITKNSSALQRCMICTSRMVVVWLGSLMLNWQAFSMVQFVGYVMLTFSIYQYNELEKQKPLKEIIQPQQSQILTV